MFFLHRLLPCVAILCLTIPARAPAASFLFDATHAETAGNADWVIDEDSGVPQRFPTPDQSTVTSSTLETYWTGAISAWGISLVKLGHHVETLPTGVAITYLNSGNVQDLSNYQVFVVDEPNTLFTAAEKSAIVNWVQAGGSLFIVADHAGSDRNGDGFDSVMIWNDLFANNGVQAAPFGFVFNSDNISPRTETADPDPTSPITHGPAGTITEFVYANGASLTIDPTKNPSVKAAVWTTASQTNFNVMVAYGTFGAGKFVATGDSSPIDDGTGAPGNNLFNGWSGDSINDGQLVMNASIWLAGTSAPTPTPTPTPTPSPTPPGSSVVITALGTPVCENFDTLASTGTSSATPTGWAFSETGSNANTTYTAGNGSSPTGDTFSFGATGSTDRAFGGLQSGSLVPTIGAVFTNNTSQTIGSLLISYQGEQWRLGALSRQDRLDFQFSSDATSLTTGTWTAVTALNFVAPVATGTVGGLDGNAAANRTFITSTISGLSIPNGASFWIRWTDFNATGADDGLGIDDFCLTANGATPTPTPTPAPVQLVGIVSEMSQGTSGTYDIDLTSGSGVECRNNPDGNYTIILTFSNNLTNVDSASVLCGSVGSSSISPNPNQYTVNLTGEGACNAQYNTVTLSNVTDSAGNHSDSVASPPWGLLLGDTTGDGSVNSGDVSQTKSQSGNSLTTTNFREDVTADGSLNSGDVSLVKSKSGTALP